VVTVRAARGLGHHRALLRDLARRALRFLGEEPCELSIALVDDRAMRDLNRAYRGMDRPTDVLSFAQREGTGVLAAELLGDVVVSFETACRQAERRKVAVEQELRHLLVHGILHLLGYDHERSRSEARRMFAKARAVEGALEGSDRLAVNPAHARRASGASA
jgi:probable rRNA maturation factor